MRVIVRKVSQNSGRILELFDIERLKGVCLETPLLLYLTKGASVPHLSKEVFDESLDGPNQAFLVSLTSTVHMKAACEKFDKSVLAFAGFPNKFQVLTVKDSVEEVKERPQKDSVALYTRSGKEVLTCEKYMSVVEAFKPDLYEALCDCDNNQASSKKRITKASERSQSFLLECIKQHKTSAVLSSTSSLIAPVQGGYSEIERQKYLKFLLENDDDSILGYSIEGLHLRGIPAASLNFETIKPIVEQCTSTLPSNKLLFMYGAYNPLTTVYLVASGIDVFDSGYVFLATQAAKVLTFSFNDSGTQYPFALDMKEERYKEDFEPFMKDCKCLACQKMTRAYVYHLVNCRELLANTLILIHNLYHYTEFFKAIRQAIKEDTLGDLINCMAQQYKELDLTVTERKEKAFCL